MESMGSIEKLTNYFMAEVGYMEKQSNTHLEDKTANAGDRNFTKYGAYFGHNGPDAYWCDYFIDYGFCQVFGRDLAAQLLGGLSGYTPTSAGYFKRMGRWYASNPQPGGIIFFKGSTRINHTGYVYKANKGMVYTIEGNTSSAAGVIRNGGMVACKEYPIASARIAGYGRPDYSRVEMPVKYVEGWQRAADGVKWWYQYSDGSYAANKWLLINHHWYLFDRAGYMMTGWRRWDGKVCDPADGSGDWYYFDPTPDGPFEGACWHSKDNGAQEIWYVESFDFKPWEVPRAFLLQKNKIKGRMNFMLVEIIGKRYEERLVTISLNVAEKFEKNHQHILEAIDKLTVENSTVAEMFKLSTYKAGNNHEYRM